MSTSSDIFLSYSRDDQAIARRFAEGFERAGFSVWWDATLSSGEAYDQVTEKALKSAKAVVVLWSKKSVESRWVRAEATIGDRNKTLVPVMIEACERPIMFELTHTADLAHWKGDVGDKAWLTYVADVRKFVHKEAPSEVPPVHAPMHSTSGRKRTVVSTIAALALLLVGGGIWWALSRDGAAPATRTVGTDAQGVTLAVLPFANLSSDPEQEYFSDGLSEELLNVLAQIKDLQVSGRTSSFSFKGKNEDLRVIGEQLGVENLLEGSVRKSGDEVRITAQLINARTGYHLWSETYDRKIEDIFAIQDEIAKAVASALSITLGVGDLGRIEGGTRNVTAYDAYLKALKPPNASESMTLYREQLDALDQAVKLDPSFALAWARIAKVSRDALDLDSPDKAAEWRQRADAAHARARELAPDSEQVLLVSAFDAANRDNLIEAERLLRKAIDQQHNAITAAAYGWFQTFAGSTRKGLDYLLEARRTEPLDPVISEALAATYVVSGMSSEAAAETERGFRLGGVLSTFNGLQLVMAMANHDHEAIRHHIEIAVQIDDVGAPFHRAILPFLDKPSEGLAEVKRLLAEPGNRVPNLRSMGTFWSAYYGDPELALALMKERLASGSFNNALLWLPVFHEMRQLPGFKDFLRERGFVDYWRSSGNWGDYCKPVGADDFACQ